MTRTTHPRRLLAVLTLMTAVLGACDDGEGSSANRCVTRRCLWNPETQTFSRDCQYVAAQAGPVCDASPPAQADCRGPGRYESGKEGSYRPCCPGLTEVFYGKAAYVNGVPACTDAPLRVYACVQGSCGDGICEPGEAPSCGCVADCPQATWGAPDAGANVAPSPAAAR